MVGLMLLLVLTLGGLAAVRLSTGQVRMAASYEMQMLAFQAADSAIREALAALRLGDAAAETALAAALAHAGEAAWTPPVRALTFGEPPLAADAQVVVRYLGAVPAAGYSLGSGPGSLVAHGFEIAASATVRRGASGSFQQQGLWRIGPGSP